MCAAHMALVAVSHREDTGVKSGDGTLWYNLFLPMIVIRQIILLLDHQITVHRLEG